MNTHRPGLLLGMMTASTALLALLFAATLYGLSYLNTPRSRSGAMQDQDRYLNLRLLAALRTFEHGIVAGTTPVTPLASGTLAATLLEAVPECATQWHKAPPWWVQQWADWRGQALPEKTLLTDMATQLPLLQKQLQTLAAPGNQRMAQAPRLDLPRWLTAVRESLNQPVKPPEDSPGPETAALRLQCSDIPLALNTLLRDNAQLLRQLDWRDTTGSSELKRWQAAQQVAIPARVIAQYNPWRGLPGCVYLNDSHAPDVRYYLSDSRLSNREICEQAAVAGDHDGVSPSRFVPLVANAPDQSLIPSLPTLLAPLETLRQPFGTLYRQMQTAQPDGTLPPANQAMLKGAPVELGFSVDLSLEAPTQTLAQQVAACYTGQQAVCKTLQLRRQSDQGGEGEIGQQLLESALVRMAGIAIIDIASGRIEALAGALSPCTRQENDGPGRDRHCDKRLPWPARYRPDALLNPAVFQDVMPASTIKPIMAAAFLSDGTAGAALLAQELALQTLPNPGKAEMPASPAPNPPRPPQSGLRHELMHSNSAAFLGRMFCAPEFKACQRPWQVQAMAGKLGWNTNCAEGSALCGKRDLLSGRSLETPAGMEGTKWPGYPVVYGRLLTAPEAGADSPAARRSVYPFGLMPPEPLATELIARCGAGADGRLGSKDDWQKCRGGKAVDMVAEGWGQGHARTTALGVAGMMAMLGAAANGASQFQPPHLVEAIHGLHFRQHWALAPALPMPLDAAAAGVLLDGLSYSHRGGTATLACQEILDGPTCKQIDWLAGKTGTPTFRNDAWSLDQIAAWCRDHPAQSSLNPISGKTEKLGNQAAPDCSSLRPYKWYTAVYSPETGTTPGKPRWQKAIAVLTERNWLKDSGKVHGAGDRGPNPAAEIALQIMLRQRALANRSATP